MLSALNFSPSLAQSGTGADFPIARTITSTSTANQSLVFTLRVTDALGCSSTALSKVTVLPSTASGRLSVYSAEPVSVLTLYPNPFDGRLLYVRGSGIKAETITLYNLTGVAQPTTSRLVEAELAEVKPLDRLPSGVYVLTLQQGDTLQSYRVLVE